SPEDAPEPVLPVEPVPARECLWEAEDGEVVDRDDRRHARARRGPERRAVQDVETVRPPGEAERVPECIARDARDSSRPAVGEQRQLEALPTTKRAEQAANVPRGAGACLYERRDVDA